MVKQIISSAMALAVTFFLLINSAAAEKFGKDDEWLIYWYICGSNLESGGHTATRNIAEMQQVKLPKNVKILIFAGGTTQWHHPTLKAGGDGIYLYSSNRLEQKERLKAKANMGNPDTLINFLKYGEENFSADHRIIIFSNHGGLGGVCYDDNFKGDGLTYDELKSAFSKVYKNSSETLPFELIGFDACMTGSYELANSISDFSHYMLGSEPNSNGLDFKALFSALAKDPSMDGYKIGKTICDNSMALYKSWFKNSDLRLYDNALSVIDLTKMPQLREAYEEYFDEALQRTQEDGFGGAFARAAEARTADRYSNLYTDLGLLAKNTKSIMPETSNKLLKAINKSVVYNKHGAYLRSKGISTYYPYISSESKPEEAVKETLKGFKMGILTQNANYKSQKELYKKLLDLKSLPEDQDVSLELNSKNHFVANLTPEQLENISSIRCLLLPIKPNDNSKLGIDLGGAILTSADDLKVNWKKGTITEDFRAVEPVFDGHKIVTLPSLSSRGHTFYKVPIIYNNALRRDLIVRYDTSANKYTIIGFGNTIENGIVRTISGRLNAGDVITPLHIIISDDPSNEAMGVEFDENSRSVRTTENESGEQIYKYAPSILSEYKDPATGKTFYLKLTKGTSFVYTRDSAITNKPITKGDYLYLFGFTSSGGYASTSQPGLIHIEYGKINKFTMEELEEISEAAQ